MNWTRIVLCTLWLVVLPNVVGFLTGITNGLWQDTLSADAELWLRRIVIGVLLLLTYVVFAVKQHERRLGHLAVVFVASEALSAGVHLGIGGPIGSVAAWTGVAAIAAAAAYSWAEWRSARRRPAA